MLCRSADREPWVLRLPPARISAQFVEATPKYVHITDCESRSRVHAHDVVPAGKRPFPRVVVERKPLVDMMPCRERFDLLVACHAVPATGVLNFKCRSHYLLAQTPQHWEQRAGPRMRTVECSDGRGRLPDGDRRNPGCRQHHLKVGKRIDHRVEEGEAFEQPVARDRGIERWETRTRAQ